ncbi:hypothetical protein DFS34DRAFT_662665 [Phlyctochytrium arcticum]|nr:hypothetical protein DFS34DRAFT_662665 [Phlyctochytrium arcticum]
MADIESGESWTDASSIIKNVWQLADCSSSSGGYSTFDGTTWNTLVSWDNVKGLATFRKQSPNSGLNAKSIALFDNVNARAACAIQQRYLMAPNVSGNWFWTGHTLIEGPPRSGYTLLSTSTQIWIIGGQLQGAGGNNTVKTSLTKIRPDGGPIQLAELQWADGPDLPYAVNHTSASAWGENGAVLFGGQSEMNPAPLMRLQNNVWSALEAKGTPPSPRLYPCIATSAAAMYVYGGRPLNATAQPDPLLYELNLESLTWSNHNLRTTTNTTHPVSISDISCHLPNPGNQGPSGAGAATHLHIISQISTPTFSGPALQVVDLNTKTWQRIHPVRTTVVGPVAQYIPEDTSKSGRTFVTIGIPVIAVLFGLAYGLRRLRAYGKVTPAANLNTITTPGPVPPPIPECPPIYGPNDIEMGDLARAIRESEVEPTIPTNQTSLSPDIPAHAPPSYDDVISSIAALPDTESARPSADSTAQSDSPHNTGIGHDTSPSLIPATATTDSSPP